MCEYSLAQEFCSQSCSKMHEGTGLHSVGALYAHSLSYKSPPPAPPPLQTFSICAEEAAAESFKDCLTIREVTFLGSDIGQVSSPRAHSAAPSPHTL